MGLAPSELIDTTPYEIFLLKEGYQKRIDDEMEQAKFVAYVTYASVMASVGVEPKTFENWNNPPEDGVRPPLLGPDGRPLPLKDGRPIDSATKKALEAKMNQI